MRVAVGAFGIILVWLLPLIVLGWVLVLATRAVQALESIAEALRERNRH